jgi:hypothetical protein
MSSSTDDNDEVKTLGYLDFVPAKDLSNATFPTVANNGVSDFSARRNAKPRVDRLVGVCVDDQTRAGGTFSHTLRAAKLASLPEALPTAKTLTLVFRGSSVLQPTNLFAHALGNLNGLVYLTCRCTQSTFRPRLRRRASTLRPPVVARRLRKPCRR